MANERLKVLRPFILDGKPTTVGQVIEVPPAFGIELRTAKKAEKTDEPLRAPREPEQKPVQKAAEPQKGVK
jgi:hypothetical protein